MCRRRGGGGGGGGWFALQPDREPLQKPDGLRPCLAAWNLQLCRHSRPNFAPRMLYDKTEAHETLMYLKTTVNVPKDYCKSFSKTKSAVEYYSQMRRRCYLVLDGGLLFFFRQKGHQLYHMRIICRATLVASQQQTKVLIVVLYPAQQYSCFEKRCNSIGSPSYVNCHSHRQPCSPNSFWCSAQYFF